MCDQVPEIQLKYKLVMLHSIVLLAISIVFRIKTCIINQVRESIFNQEDQAGAANAMRESLTSLKTSEELYPQWLHARTIFDIFSLFLSSPWL